MMIKGKSCFQKTLWGVGMGALFTFSLMSCASMAANEFDPTAAGPQLIVDPGTIRLGVATLRSTEIVFRGKGFQPGDSVFITLKGVKKDGQIIDIPIADGNVDQQGYFSAKVGILVKVAELLRGEIESDDELRNVIVLSQPPIETGTYATRAVSMESDEKAECELVIKGPSLMDRFKDLIGRMLGRIKKK